MPVVTKMLAEAWHREQLLYELTFAAAKLPTLTPTLVVLLSGGAVIGFVMIFALDEYKRIQRVLLLFSLPLFALAMFGFDIWTSDNLNWARYWWGLPGGVVLGSLFAVVGGSIPSGSEGRRTFPTAARLIYIVAVGAVALGLVECAFRYQSPLRAQDTPGSALVLQSPGLPAPALDIWILPYMAASTIFVAVVGIFVSYSDRSSVLVLTAPNDKNTAVGTLRGLYNAAKTSTTTDEVKPTEGSEDVLVETQVADSLADLDVDQLPNRVGFRFVRDGPFSQRRIVEYTNYELPDGSELAEIEHRAVTNNATGWLGTRFIRRFAETVPEWMSRPWSASNTGHVQHVENADTAILCVSLIELLPASREESAEQHEQPAYVETLRRLYEVYRDSSSHDIFFVVYGAGRGLEAYEAEHGYEPLLNSKEFEDFVAENVIGLEESNSDIIIVSENNNPETDMAGFAEVLQRL